MWIILSAPDKNTDGGGIDSCKAAKTVLDVEVKIVLW